MVPAARRRFAYTADIIMNFSTGTSLASVVGWNSPGGVWPYPQFYGLRIEGTGVGWSGWRTPRVGCVEKSRTGNTYPACLRGCAAEASAETAQLASCRMPTPGRSSRGLSDAYPGQSPKRRRFSVSGPPPLFAAGSFKSAFRDFGSKHLPEKWLGNLDSNQD